ncbi:hypothetical protein [Cohnella faecalis]|uniref:hypothetical protein n=1 Tax=Cohnella faecalis TaxID=2315694 RepID=UPI001F401DDF|nr:hypothetical protein [Cohnella faecalis]
MRFTQAIPASCSSAARRLRLSKAVIYGKCDDYNVSLRPLPDSVPGPHSRKRPSAGGIQPLSGSQLVDLEYFDAGDLLLQGFGMRPKV